ncbi:DUF1786 domain-containing protein [Pseudodesulfovibrio senegalensis]
MFFAMNATTLCLDIGSGTQDVLLHIPDREPENCPKFVLPSPALQVGKRIAELTRQQKAIWLHGHNMGGGVTRFVRAHLKAGLAVSAQPSAAYTMGDDLTRVESMGVTLSEDCPDGHEPVLFSDFDRSWWERFFEAAELDWPDRIAACAQDHGFHPGTSNRIGRFKLWEQLLGDGQGRPESLLFQDVPSMMTRLADLQACIGNGPVADTGAAAVLGALYVVEIEEQSHSRGITLVNVGNSHTVAFLLYRGRIFGIYEHHTGLLDEKTLWQDLHSFREGRLAHQNVFDANGHGCLTLPLPEGAQGFAPVHVLGPRRAMLENHDVSFPSPGGDMMLAGSFGLIKGMAMQG